MAVVRRECMFDKKIAHVLTNLCLRLCKVIDHAFEFYLLDFFLFFQLKNILRSTINFKTFYGRLTDL